MPPSPPNGQIEYWKMHDLSLLQIRVLQILIFFCGLISPSLTESLLDCDEMLRKSKNSDEKTVYAVCLLLLC